jgi:hypothetical protein
VNDISVQTGFARLKFYALTRSYAALTPVVTPLTFFDTETDGICASKVHCIAVFDFDSDVVEEFGPDQIEAGLLKAYSCLRG